MSDYEPPHRVQKYALPDSAPVIAQAQQRRQVWLVAMRSVSQSSVSEHEREARQDLDNESTGSYDD